MSRILITGGAGFVGSQLGRHLVQSGADVLLLDNMSGGYEDNVVESGRPFAELAVMDIRNPDLSKEMRGVDVVFHFAATSMLAQCQVNAAEAYDNNVTGLVNVLDWARRERVRRVVFSSTSAIYENNTIIPFKESDSVAPDLVYASTKLAGELICKAFAQTYDMDIVVPRFFNVYGEHMDIHRAMPPFVSYLAREVFYERKPILFNKSDALRDYVYVSDVIEALIRMAYSDRTFRGDILNICSGVGFSVKQIVALYGEASGRHIEAIYKDPTTYWDRFPKLFEGFALNRDRVVKEVHKNSIGDVSKARDLLGFETKISFAQGLKRIFEFSSSQLSR
jgi:UDP-glucose 4-epimerase